MEKKIGDYLHLYLGQQYRASYIETPNSFTVWAMLTPGRLDRLSDLSIYKVELSLRRLSDMTEEEYEHIAIAADEYHFSNKEEEIHVGKQYVKAGRYFPDQFQWFLSRGFDLFNLIDSGLAIDRSTLKTAPHE